MSDVNILRKPIQYCAIETCGKNEITFISRTCFTQISQIGFLVKQFSLIFSPFPWCGGTPGNSVSPLGKHNSPIFPPITPEFRPNFPWISTEFPRFPNDSYWFPSFLCSFKYNFTSIHCLWASGLRYFMHIHVYIHISLKMRIPHYARQRIINLGNSGEIQGNSGGIRRKAFHSFSLVFSGVKHISLLGKSNSPDFSSETKNYKSGEFWGNSGKFSGNQTKSFSFVFTRFLRCEIHFPLGEIKFPWFFQWLPWKLLKTPCEKKWEVIHEKTWIPFPFHFISPPPPPPRQFQFYSTVYTRFQATIVNSKKKVKKKFSRQLAVILIIDVKLTIITMLIGP